MNILETIFAANKITQGKIWHVKPYSGHDSRDGKTPDKAFKTLAQAQSKAVADRNDIVLLYAESNTAANTTDYQSSTLDWAKDMVHLIGVNAGSPLSHRSRIAFASTYATASNLFTLSADACLIANVALFAGVTSTSPTGCVQQTGDKNHWLNCMISGIGADTNDIAGAYSLYLNGVQETLFEDCYIGLETIDAGSAANSEILLASTVKNNIFRGCTIIRRIEHGTNHPLIKIAAATSLEGVNLFERNCGFISHSTNNAYSNAGVFKFAVTPTQGKIIIDPTCYATNGTTAGKWDVDDNDVIVVTGSPTPAADTAQIGRYV